MVFWWTMAMSENCDEVTAVRRKRSANSIGNQHSAAHQSVTFQDQ